MKRELPYIIAVIVLLTGLFAWHLYQSSSATQRIPQEMESEEYFQQEYGAKPYTGAKVELSPDEWRERLTEEQFVVLREKGTERAFSGKYTFNKEPGTYLCAGCELTLFSSEDKFDSGTGWPSFTQPINPSHVGYELDESLFTTRVEVHCNRCGGHLGHVFNDGPKPTGHRYCINSVSLLFSKEE